MPRPSTMDSVSDVTLAIANAAVEALRGGRVEIPEPEEGVARDVVRWGRRAVELLLEASRQNL